MMYLEQQVLLITLDIEITFHSVDYCFLLPVLERYSFEERFLKWIQILIQNEEFCVVNYGITTKSFSLDRGARQGDPISAFFFVIALEVFFLLIKSCSNINDLDICGHNILYSIRR